MATTSHAAARTRPRATSRLAVLFAMAVGVAASSVAWPVAARDADGFGGESRRISMGVGTSKMLTLPRDAAEIFVADPKIANVIVRSAREIIVIGSGGGSTTVYATDSQGKPILSFDLSIGRDIDELNQLLKAALPGSVIVPKTINDTIILTGVVNSASEAQKALDIANGFVSSGGMTAVASGGVTTTTNASGGKVIDSLTIRGRDQVMLKVTIAEVQRTVLKQLGVTGAIAQGSWGTISLPNSFPLNGGLQPAGALSPKAAAGFFSGATIGSLGASALSAQLEAYETNGVARILAEPSVTAISGESAKFNVGGQIPIPAGTACTNGSCTTGVDFKTVGVSLNFEPVVLADGRILLHLGTEVDEVDNTITINIGGSAVPGFKTRKNETSVELPSGGSIVSAGLIQTRSASAIQGLPGLMNLPILGTLFRSRDYQRSETELLIVVTPFIAKPSNPSDIKRPTDGFADPSDPQGSFMGRVNQVYSTTSNPMIVDQFKAHVGFIAD